MKYLLDVNVLLAWHHGPHQHYSRFHVWMTRVDPRDLATCAITELGFVRISMGAFGYSRSDALTALAAMRRTCGEFIGELPAVANLPSWGNRHDETTDGYLCRLAAKNGLRLATFDTRIKDPAAMVIP